MATDDKNAEVSPQQAAVLSPQQILKASQEGYFTARDEYMSKPVTPEAERALAETELAYEENRLKYDPTITKDNRPEVEANIRSLRFKLGITDSIE